MCTKAKINASIPQKKLIFEVFLVASINCSFVKNIHLFFFFRDDFLRTLTAASVASINSFIYNILFYNNGP